MSCTTDKLIQKYDALVRKTTEHKFAKELCAGTLKDRSLYIYLSQDLQFFETSLRLICKTTSLAPTTHALITLAKKIGFFSNDENSYFHDCLELLAPSLTKEERDNFDNKAIPGVDAYINFLDELRKDASITWPSLVTSLWVAEEHDGEHFQTWCEFLKAEVDKFPVEEVESIFVKVSQFEFEFFESCYNA